MYSQGEINWIQFLLNIFYEHQNWNPILVILAISPNNRFQKVIKVPLESPQRVRFEFLVKKVFCADTHFVKSSL